MATMNISLPDQMKAWVEAQSKDGKYANSSDYVRELIRRDVEQFAKDAAMADRVRAAYASGFVEKTVDDFMDEAWAAALKATDSA
ncbi:MAG: type II toxin-antitoxin system ParD family antitoxin [Pseudomonadota bacterium]